ncbi:hypothetical protein [Curtobacterium sp. PhB115]|uniref:hypothetical protein n=1 Tax=Curtobacterium sp. PhB115 TaxID=2485173 RepID=UPI000F4CBE58|nr:hypothetical protein [Curtobacterium sp. PhB115]
MNALPYDPPSERTLETVALEIIAAVDSSVDTWHRYRQLEPTIADVVPPFVREYDVGYACRDDWHGGDPGPAMRRILGDLEAADAIRPLRTAAAEALVDFHTRWARRHGGAPSTSDRSAATWEIVDVDRFESRVAAFTRHPASVSAAVRAGVDRFADA